MNRYQLTKAEALAMFSGTRGLARALECNPSSISRYPETLSLRVSRQIIGAAVQLGVDIPADIKARFN